MVAGVMREKRCLTVMQILVFHCYEYPAPLFGAGFVALFGAIPSSDRSFSARTRGQEAVFLCLKYAVAFCCPGFRDWVIT